MLSNHQCQLLTAYIDGELNAGERQTVDKLLVTSAEARAFLEKLEDDSKELHRLPSRRAPDTLVNLVMETVCDDQPLPPAKPPAATSIPRWLGLTVVAFVLGLVAMLTFVLASGLLSKGP